MSEKEKGFFDKLDENTNFAMNFFYYGIERVCFKFNVIPPKILYHDEGVWRTRLLTHFDVEEIEKKD